jgi:hypothetical protein
MGSDAQGKVQEIETITRIARRPPHPDQENGDRRGEKDPSHMFSSIVHKCDGLDKASRERVVSLLKRAGTAIRAHNTPAKKNARNVVADLVLDPIDWPFIDDSTSQGVIAFYTDPNLRHIFDPAARWDEAVRRPRR